MAVLVPRSVIVLCVNDIGRTIFTLSRLIVMYVKSTSKEAGKLLHAIRVSIGTIDLYFRFIPE